MSSSPTCRTNGRFLRPAGRLSLGWPAIIAAAANRSARRGATWYTPSPPAE
ncbi:MAG: hypothetical protein ACKO26_15355 [Planctomycetota bacterium]